MTSLFKTHHDFDGTLLSSLSLDDTNNNNNYSMINYPEEEDDLMDIDDIEDTTMQEIDNTVQDTITQKFQYIPKEDDEDEYEDDHEDSIISSLLSPTMLGAKLAIKPQLLLMPPPTPVPDKDKIDYEFNTSQMTRLSKNNVTSRNVSVYSPVSNINQFLTKENTTNYNPVSTATGASTTPYENSMNQSYMMRKTFSNPTTVHLHNHYYFNPPNQEVVQTSQHQTPPPTQQQLQIQPQKLTLPVPWKSNISPHDRIPYILSSYLQLALNILASIYVIHLIRSFTLAIKHDITYRISQHANSILSSIETCKRHYIENKCHPDTIVPLLEKKCAMYKQCMNQDPGNGAGNLSKITLETISMLINSIFEPLGIKFFLMMFGFISIVFVWNFSCGYIRAKTYYGWDNPNKS
ncbi:Nucleus export protein BRL1 [Spathaspora sp. JA1]|nr:Nucleus export protein BRL1 [Spathaspora sp. JA1]